LSFEKSVVAKCQCIPGGGCPKKGTGGGGQNISGRARGVRGGEKQDPEETNKQKRKGKEEEQVFEDNNGQGNEETGGAKVPGAPFRALQGRFAGGIKVKQARTFKPHRQS